MNTITNFCTLCDKEETFYVEDFSCDRCVASAHGPVHAPCRLHKSIHCTADACF